MMIHKLAFESRKDEIAQYNLVIKKIHDSAYSFIVD